MPYIKDLTMSISNSKCDFGRNFDFGRDRKNRINAEIVFHIAGKIRLDQLKNLSNAVVSFRIDHILNHY